jgi:hypothetical protein
MQRVYSCREKTTYVVYASAVAEHESAYTSQNEVHGLRSGRSHVHNSNLSRDYDFMIIWLWHPFTNMSQKLCYTHRRS